MPRNDHHAPFSDEELEREQATDLPDREAMSVLTPGAMVPPMPVDQPVDPSLKGPELQPQPMPPTTDTLQPLPETPLGRTDI